MRLLIVGFGPFPRVPRNPSGLLARRLSKLPRLRRCLGEAPECLVMRTAYDAIPKQLEPALAARPDAVLMIGVATRARRIRVETRAKNRVSRLFPDASGTVSARPTLDQDGPAERRSPAARGAMLRLRRRGLDASLSIDAGRYLCNATYYRVLAERNSALFLHIPPLPDPGRPVRRPKRRRGQVLASWTDAFADVALALTRSVSGGHRRGADRAPE